MGLPFVCLAAHGFGASSMARGSDFGKCQTFAASPAEPGELPLWFSELPASKYPPAKPGALRCEPLKAAYPGGFGVVSHLLRGMRHQVPKLTILITCVSGCTPIRRGVIFASSSIDGAPFRVLGGPRIQSFIDGRGSDFGK